MDMSNWILLKITKIWESRLGLGKITDCYRIQALEVAGKTDFVGTHKVNMHQR